jgi:hypothetical protein
VAVPIPAGGGTTPPDWTPTLDEVADYCTARTLVPQLDGSNLELQGFDSTTRPSASQVARIIADSVAWVQLKAGVLDATLYTAANMVATVRTAGFIELRFPERQSTNRDDAITTAKELLKQADQMRNDLALANEVITGDDPTDPDDPDGPGGGSGVLPVWSFPPAPPLCTPYAY